jgi:tetratricopeptide (TPR) repeat protein
VTGAEVILAALAVGAGAGTSDVAETALMDAYTGLRDALRRRLAGRPQAARALEADETDPGAWQARLGADLTDSGADRDEQVLAAAQRLLEFAGPAGARAGRYAVDANGARQVQAGDGTVHVDTNYGAAAGTITGPVSISYGQLPVPQARPEALAGSPAPGTGPTGQASAAHIGTSYGPAGVFHAPVAVNYVTVEAEREVYRLVAWPRPQGVSGAREQPSRLLAAQYAVVPFDVERRRAQIERMTAWREAADSAGGAGMSVLLAYGPGGQGKTRLAAYVAEESAREGWRVVAARHGPGAGLLASSGPQSGRGLDSEGATGDARGLLVVTDYAERWPAVDLLALVQDLSGIGMPVRLLLVARPAGLWWSALAHELRASGSPAQALALPALAAEVADRQAVFTAARDAFAAVLDVPGADQIPPPAALAGRGFQQVLTVHMAALVAVHERSSRPQAREAGGDRATADADPVALAAYLLDRERAHWQQVHASGVIATQADTMAAAAYLATLTGPLAYSDGQEVLARTGLASTAETARQVLADHAYCYPPPATAAAVLEPLYPDRLGEDFLALQTPLLPGTEAAGLYADPDPWTTRGYRADPWADTVLTTLLTPADNLPGRLPGYARSVITVLIETARRWPHIAQQRLYPLLEAQPHLAVAAGSAALTALASLDRDTAADTGVLSALEKVEAALPARRDADLDIGAVAVTRRLVDHRLAATSDPAEQAGLHLTLGYRYGHARLYQQAVEHTAQAASLLLPLAQADPDAHLRTLITAMNNLSVGLGCLGQPEPALTAISPVVGLRRLAEQHPESYLPDLAVGLANLSVALGAAGRREDALAAITEAVQIRRSLAEQHPDAWLPDLISDLNNLAVCSAGLERWQDSLAASTEAVEISRRLAAQAPGAFLLDLVSSLTNLSVALGAAGRREAALAAITEAVTSYRRLAEQHPEGYLPDLATGLTNLSINLGELGRREEALAAITEAVDIRRRLAAQHPGMHLPDLANSLNVLSVWLGDLRRREDSLAAISEAVQIRRGLAEQHPDVSTPHLADSLSNLSINLGELGRREEALAAITEAVDIRRRLAEQHPGTFLSGLADSLHNLAVHLARLGRRGQGLAAITEAVDIRRRLAAQHPPLTQPNSTTTTGSSWSWHTHDCGHPDHRHLDRLTCSAIPEAALPLTKLSTARLRPPTRQPDLSTRPGDTVDFRLERSRSQAGASGGRGLRRRSGGRCQLPWQLAVRANYRGQPVPTSSSRPLASSGVEPTSYRVRVAAAAGRAGAGVLNLAAGGVEFHVPGLLRAVRSRRSGRPGLARRAACPRIRTPTSASPTRPGGRPGSGPRPRRGAVPADRLALRAALFSRARPARTQYGYPWSTSHSPNAESAHGQQSSKFLSKTASLLAEPGWPCSNRTAHAPGGRACRVGVPRRLQPGVLPADGRRAHEGPRRRA